MSGHPDRFDHASQQPLATSDSRLLDAAETLVNLQAASASRSSIRSGATSQPTASKSRPVYLAPHQASFLAGTSKMSPHPTNSQSSSVNMGPPPQTSSSASDGMTVVFVNQQPTLMLASNDPKLVQSQQQPIPRPGSTDLMRPPTQPPPRRGRGRGRGRGASAGGESTRGSGRGRGRGRGTAKIAPAPMETPQAPDSKSDQDHQPQDLANAGEDSEMPAADENISKEIPETTFQVGDMTVKDSIFDDILSKHKLELMTDPDVLALLASQQRRNK